MSTTHEAVRHGDAPATGGARTSKALEVASRGIRTPRDITNFSIAHSIDVLQETVGAKQANASLRGVTVGLRAVEIGQRVGQYHEVAGVSSESDDGGNAAETRKEAVARRKAELTEELERLCEAENQ